MHPTSTLMLTLACCLFAGGCAEQGRDERAPPSGAAVQCEVRVIVSLTVDFDAALVAELERAARARLEPIAAIARDVNTFALRTEGSDSACLDAIERLRRDSRVRSVEVDVRRELHAP